MQLFRARKGKDDKKPWLLMQLFKDLLDTWVPPGTVGREVLANQILLEQYIQDLKEGMQLWVRRHLPRSAEEAQRIAEMETVKERSYKSERSHYCTEEEYYRGPSRHAGKGVLCY